MVRVLGGNQIPSSRIVWVACAGLVAFMALMQGGLASIGYAGCGRPNQPNMLLAVTDLALAGIAYFVFLSGAIRLRRNWDTGKAAYIATITALLTSACVMSAVFIAQTTCVG